MKARRLAQVPEWDVPDGAAVVTMAVDVQDDRLEYELAFCAPAKRCGNAIIDCMEIQNMMRWGTGCWPQSRSRTGTN